MREDKTPLEHLLDGGRIARKCDGHLETCSFSQTSMEHKGMLWTFVVPSTRLLRCVVEFLGPHRVPLCRKEDFEASVAKRPAQEELSKTNVTNPKASTKLLGLQVGSSCNEGTAYGLFLKPSPHSSAQQRQPNPEQERARAGSKLFESMPGILLQNFWACILYL